MEYCFKFCGLLRKAELYNDSPESSYFINVCLSSQLKVIFFIPANKGQEFDCFQQEIDTHKGQEISEAIFLGFNFLKSKRFLFS